MGIVKAAVHILLCLVVIYLSYAAFSELQLLRMLESDDNPAAHEKDDDLVWDDLVWDSPTDLDIYIKEGHRKQYYPWAWIIEEWSALIILAAGAGFLGGTARALRDSRAAQRSDRNSIIHAAYGAILGTALVGVLMLSSQLLVGGDLRFQALSVAIVSFLGGAFSDKAWAFLGRHARRRFNGRA